MDSLTRARWLRRAAVGAAASAIVALCVYHALRPAPAPAPEDVFTQSVLALRPGDLPPEQREQLQRQWESFPPESRTRIFRAVARARLDELRAETAGMDPEERAERLRQTLTQMRRRRQGLSAAEREHISRRLDEPQTREIVAEAMAVYRDELTARERAELDPLLQEWLAQIEWLSRRR